MKLLITLYIAYKFSHVPLRIRPPRRNSNCCWYRFYSNLRNSCRRCSSEPKRGRRSTGRGTDVKHFARATCLIIFARYEFASILYREYRTALVVSDSQVYTIGGSIVFKKNYTGKVARRNANSLARVGRRLRSLISSNVLLLTFAFLNRRLVLFYDRDWEGKKKRKREEKRERERVRLYLMKIVTKCMKFITSLSALSIDRVEVQRFG